MDIKYSIARGSLVKPTGVMMYSERCTNNLISDNWRMDQADC